MFRAIFKLLSSALYYLTACTVDLEKYFFEGNAAVIAQKYDAVIETKRKELGELFKSIEALSRVNAEKESNLKRKTEEIEKMRKNQLAAKNKAMKLAEGRSKEEAESNLEYIKAKAAYTDYATTVAEKEKQCQDIEKDFAEREETIKKYKTQYINKQRELEKLGDEKHETIADITTAKQAADANKQTIGLNTTASNEMLRDLRDQRSKALNSLKVSSDLSGLSSKEDELEFETYAERSEAENEFDQAMGYAVKVEEKTEVQQEKAKLPE
jgi:hypothetical protein